MITTILAVLLFVAIPITALSLLGIALYDLFVLISIRDQYQEVEKRV
jgi:hypothetical protein